MALTKAFNKDKWEESTKDVLYEWLTHANCFNSQSTGRVSVVTWSSTGQERLEVPRCEIDIINVMNESTGAGKVGAGGAKTNAQFRTVIVEITMKASRDDAGGRVAELNLIRETDILDKYFRSILGESTLGESGFRKAKLEGPFKDNNQFYYQRRYILSFQIEVS